MVVKFFDGMKRDSEYPYTALSYRWGDLRLLDRWMSVPDCESGGKKRWKKKELDGSWSFLDDCPDRIKLRRGLEADILYRDGSLNEMISSIPKTIRDAIDVTRDMGLEYIWVDELCIMQAVDDPDNKLKIGRMDLIYNHALITIVAADELDADCGWKGAGCERGKLKQISEEIIPGTNMSLHLNIELNIQSWEGPLPREGLVQKTLRFH